MNILNRSRIDRRAFLRSGRAAIMLPLLDAMVPIALGAESKAKAEAMTPRRMVLIHRPLGTYHPYLIPTTTGLDYEAPRFLKKLESVRGKFTVFSGMSHLGYPNAHDTEPAIFTGVPNFNQRDLHNSISLDQVVAKKIGDQTRIPHLVLHSVGSQSLSWNDKGIPTPHDMNPSLVFRRMFLDGTPEEVKREIQRLEHGKSILDDMADQFKSLGRALGAGDRNRLDQLASSIREAESQLAQEKVWAMKPKPKVDANVSEIEQAFGANNWVKLQQKWLALVHLALLTDSTRVIVLALNEHDLVNQADLSIGHHDASHHGKDPEKIEQLARYEDKDFATFAELLDKLAASDEGGQSLLDKTQVLFTSNLGDASAHASNNLPVLVAGGGYKHQGHVAFDVNNNKPLSNLYVRMLQQMDIETDTFGSSTGTLTEIGSAHNLDWPRPALESGKGPQKPH